MKGETTPIAFAAVVALATLVALGFAVAAGWPPLLQAGRDSGTTTADYWRDDGPILTAAAEERLGPAKDPLAAWRSAPLGVGLVVGAGIVALLSWSLLGAFRHRSPHPVMWSAGAFLPVAAALGWFAARLPPAIALHTGGDLGDSVGLGTATGEALVPLVTAVELGALLLVVLLAARTLSRRKRPA